MPGRRGRRAGGPALLIAVLIVLGVSAVAGAQCQVRVDAGVAYGVYSVFDAKPLDGTGVVSWRCPPGQELSVQMTLSSGRAFDGAFRRLQGDTGDFLRYNLYLDSARTSVWGDGSFGSPYVGRDVRSGWIKVFVYGRVPSSQDVAAGTYGDAVTVMINF